MTPDRSPTARPGAWFGPNARARVWAPRAERVAVQVWRGGRGGTRDEDGGVAGGVAGSPGAARVALAPDDDHAGWWALPDGFPDLADGDDYAFVLDDGDPRPDPRSACQPHGVHGPSRVVDPAGFAWTDAGWRGRDVRGAVVYELHVGTFTTGGTLDSAVERLDHLADLGVDVVELMPVAAWEGDRGWGYDGVALYAVHAAYGGPAALARFVDAAHARGLAVCLDVVYNHLGPSGNYLPEFGPYFTDRHTTPWGDAVNLDGPDAAEVRRFVVDNALRWCADLHLDALRLDAVHALVDDSGRPVLAELADEVAALSARLGRPLSLVAESDRNDPATVTPTVARVPVGGAAGPPGRRGLGMTAQWADDVHHAIHALLTGERQGYYADFGSPAALARAFTRVFVPDGGWSGFREQRWGAPVPGGTDGHRFVVCDADHDQVGNRALGDRPSLRLTDGELAASAALVLCSPFTPMLWMGEEWGALTPWLFFTDHRDPALARAVREGRRAEFAGHGWAEPDLVGADGGIEVPDPQAVATFQASRLDWDEAATARGQRLLGWFRGLVALRRSSPDLASGDLAATAVRWDEAASWGADTRGDESSGVEAGSGDEPGSGDRDGGAAGRSWLVVHRGPARVVVNLGDSPRQVPLERDQGGARLLVGASWHAPDDAGRPVEDDALEVRGRSAVVLVPAPVSPRRRQSTTTSASSGWRST